MYHAPINPSDIYFANGVYGERKALPAVIGFEGCGKIVDAKLTREYEDKFDKNALIDSKVGLWISRNSNSGTWGEYCITDIDNIIQL